MLRKKTKDTYVAEIFVEKLNVSVNDLECQQFIVFTLDATAEVQACISTNDEWKLCIYQQMQHSVAQVCSVDTDIYNTLI